MSLSGSGSVGKYQSAGTSYAPSCSVELRTVTVLPGGNTGGPSKRRVATLKRVKISVPITLMSDGGCGASAAVVTAAVAVIGEANATAEGAAVSVDFGSALSAPACISSADSTT